MRIRIKRISLVYFKGFRSLSLDVDKDVVEIFGDNGTGKTSICDAIQWCLFGKNLAGDTKFGIKTLDKDGVAIANVEHSVTLLLDVDGKEMQVKRCWVEIRKTDRGREAAEIEHKAEFYINGEKYTKRDFDSRMSQMISETTFRLVTNPQYFFNLKWQEQRAILQEMAVGVDFDKVADDYVGMRERLAEHEGLDGYMKHLSYNIKQLKEKLGEIPLRIDELQQMCPQEEDWSGIEDGISETKSCISRRQQELAGLKQGASNAQSNMLRKSLDFERRRIDNMIISSRNMAAANLREKDERVNTLRQSISKMERDLQDIRGKASSYRVLRKRCEEDLAAIGEDIESFRKEWKDNEALKVVVTEDMLVCPVCGKPFDEEQRERHIKQIVEKFNDKKAAKKTKLRERSEVLKRDKAAAEAQIKLYDEYLSSFDTSELEDKIGEKKQMLSEEEARELASADELLALNPSYADAVSKAEELEKQLSGDALLDNKDAIMQMEGLLRNSEELLEELMKKRSRMEQFNTCHDRLSKLEESEGVLNEELDRYMEELHKAKCYEDACNNLLEESVNDKFRLARFRLFETLNDGTKKANCVCWVATPDGCVPYSDANAAMKMNTGRDIVDALSAFYNVHAPVCTDNAESTNSFIEIGSQDFRFYVSHDKSLIIK